MASLDVLPSLPEEASNDFLNRDDGLGWQIKRHHGENGYRRERRVYQLQPSTSIKE
jgi:hypothetical protein